MGIEYRKVHSAGKKITTKGETLNKVVLNTMRTISNIVGASLGPGGQPVLIERQEEGLPPILTKDGVTIFKSLGFEESTAQCILEASRDAAVRTAAEAGDGTTSATILAESIVRLTHEYCKANPRISPQKVVRHLEQTFKTIIEPEIKNLSIAADISSPEGRSLLHSVAQISANGDKALADSVMDCFDICGDEGNVTITEVNGPSHYEVDKIEGYPLNIGYDESAGKFYPKFINDPGTQRCVLEKPVFICYHGRITEIQTLINILEKVGSAWQEQNFEHNVVIFAIGYSEIVLGQLAFNFSQPASINVFPLLVPASPFTNGQHQILEDVCAVTGSELFDPINKPLEAAELEDLGRGVRVFECSRFRSNIVGFSNEDALLLRIDELKTLIQNPESELDRIMLQERLAKLTGGIAKLKVVGASNGELKEKRDRAEDAVCAVRGAIKHGCLPGGGWTLLRLCHILPDNDINNKILKPALIEPVERLLTNCGIIDPMEGQAVMAPILGDLKSVTNPTVYDALEGKHVKALDGGILDSTPAVLEAIRNSLSIASILGSLGGAVVQPRDVEYERTEAHATAGFLRDANTQFEERP